MLQSEADFARIIVGGRWLVNGQYLTTRLRQPNFNPAMGKTTKTTLWVRLSGLPLDYYGQEILTRIGNHLWKFLKIDARTLMLVCESLCESEYPTTPCTCCLYGQVPYVVFGHSKDVLPAVGVTVGGNTGTARYTMPNQKEALTSCTKGAALGFYMR
ncbi:hypothetical protein M9H77_13710 [Catharanthus roseus]|uniref:Uncharacterized protein n=1 Tax=Catharanthus roseus TaxID=4058 RepID=A0ACC0BL80_CATRO|nr:hypothetical protein M9H77_13710 [Catharanthus roseus]